jgi:hypothetical protein
VGRQDPGAYVFYEEDSEENLVLNNQGKIKGATLEKLVERATYEKGFGMSRNVAQGMGITNSQRVMQIPILLQHCC